MALLFARSDAISNSVHAVRSRAARLSAGGRMSDNTLIE
ncbi:hypothetical protein GGR01_000132 [Acetobacter oeni]|nr:hypothetical protein [Acetobacter oeni]